MTKSDVRYQLSVAGILRNPSGEILICERIDTHGAWQFPQGGVSGKESLEEALEREIAEEISLQSTDFRILERRGPYRYLFGAGRKKKRYHGKEQHYFLLESLQDRPPINLQTAHPEFQTFHWIRPQNFHLGWVSQAKRPVYRQVFEDFFGLKL